MSERLTDEELARLAEIGETHGGGITLNRRNAALVFAELRERRARDLTDEDLDWLRKLRDYNLKHAPSEVRAVLDKLLGKGGA